MRSDGPGEPRSFHGPRKRKHEWQSSSQRAETAYLIRNVLPEDPRQKELESGKFGRAIAYWAGPEERKSRRLKEEKLDQTADRLHLVFPISHDRGFKTPVEA